MVSSDGPSPAPCPACGDRRLGADLAAARDRIAELDANNERQAALVTTLENRFAACTRDLVHTAGARAELAEQNDGLRAELAAAKADTCPNCGSTPATCEQAEIKCCPDCAGELHQSRVLVIYHGLVVKQLKGDLAAAWTLFQAQADNYTAEAAAGDRSAPPPAALGPNGCTKSAGCYLPPSRCVLCKVPAAPADICRPVEIDGETVLVHGGEQLYGERLAAFETVVRAAKAKYAAEHPAAPPDTRSDHERGCVGRHHADGTDDCVVSVPAPAPGPGDPPAAEPGTFAEFVATSPQAVALIATIGQPAPPVADDLDQLAEFCAVAWDEGAAGLSHTPGVNPYRDGPGDSAPPAAHAFVSDRPSLCSLVVAETSPYGQLRCNRPPDHAVHQVPADPPAAIRSEDCDVQVTERGMHEAGNWSCEVTIYHRPSGIDSGKVRSTSLLRAKEQALRDLRDKITAGDVCNLCGSIVGNRPAHDLLCATDDYVPPSAGAGPDPGAEQPAAHAFVLPIRGLPGHSRCAFVVSADDEPYRTCGHVASHPIHIDPQAAAGRATP